MTDEPRHLVYDPDDPRHEPPHPDEEIYLDSIWEYQGVRWARVNRGQGWTWERDWPLVGWAVDR
jgi:hypothetical protein